jgi:hypothetical protein
MYAVVPHGNRFEAHPDGTVEKVGNDGAYERSFWQFMFDRKDWKVPKKRKSAPNEQ